MQLPEVCIIYRPTEVTIAFIKNDKSRSDRPPLSSLTSRAKFLIHFCLERKGFTLFYDARMQFSINFWASKIPLGKSRLYDISKSTRELFYFSTDKMIWYSPRACSLSHYVSAHAINCRNRWRCQTCGT